LAISAEREENVDVDGGNDGDAALVVMDGPVGD